jgi:hypothetical protein
LGGGATGNRIKHNGGGWDSDGGGMFGLVIDIMGVWGFHDFIIGKRTRNSR